MTTLRLKELREAHDPPITQEQLAVRAGVAVRTVTRAEKGTHTTSRDNLKKIARVLGVKLDDLYEEVSV